MSPTELNTTDPLPRRLHQLQLSSAGAICTVRRSLQLSRGDRDVGVQDHFPRGAIHSFTAGKATVDSARHQEQQITGTTEGRGHNEFQLLFQQCQQNTFRETLRVKIFNSTVDNVVVRYCLLYQMNKEA